MRWLNVENIARLQISDNNNNIIYPRFEQMHTFKHKLQAFCIWNRFQNLYDFIQNDERFANGMIYFL